jgi:hypothetical protein
MGKLEDYGLDKIREMWEDGIILSWDESSILITGTTYSFNEVMKQIEQKLLEHWDLASEQWTYFSNKTTPKEENNKP